jgi:hypothetical protein
MGLTLLKSANGAQPMQKRFHDNAPGIALYAVLHEDGTYFAGFDPVKEEAIRVTDVFKAKLFTNKFKARLRPGEQLVELLVDLNEANTRISRPFRPKRRTDPQSE